MMIVMEYLLRMGLITGVSSTCAIPGTVMVVPLQGARGDQIVGRGRIVTDTKIEEMSSQESVLKRGRWPAVSNTPTVLLISSVQISTVVRSITMRLSLMSHASQVKTHFVRTFSLVTPAAMIWVNHRIYRLTCYLA